MAKVEHYRGLDTGHSNQKQGQTKNKEMEESTTDYDNNNDNQQKQVVTTNNEIF